MSDKKTALDYFYSQLEPHERYQYESEYNKAKAMEEEQIQEAFKQGYECDELDEIFEIGETMFTAEEYYNKKYRGDTIQNETNKTNNG
jgi:hypothetical protein